MKKLDINSYNGNRFIAIDHEELTALELIGKMVTTTNDLIEDNEELKESNSKKVSYDELHNTYKLSNKANFTGSWHGISRPEYAEPGLAGVVVTHSDYINHQKENMIDVKLIGAKGDDVSNDTQYFKQAIDYLKSVGGGQIIVPRGNFRINLLEENNTGTLQSYGIKIRGMGKSSVLKSYNATGNILEFRGSYTTPTDIINKIIEDIEIEDIKIDGEKKNVVGLDLKRGRQFRIKNVFITQCKYGGLSLLDFWDSEYNNVDIVYCGSVDSVMKPSIAILGELDNSNANKFIGCRFEKTPIFVYATKDSRHNYFTNCKFEKGVKNTTSMRPLHFADCLQFGFTDCFFVNSESTYSSTSYIADEGKPFIYVTDEMSDYAIGAKLEKSVLFEGCHFDTPRLASSNWIDCYYTKINNCSFNKCEGTLKYINVNGFCDISKSEFNSVNGKSVLKVSGNRNTVHLKVNYKGTPDVGSMISFMAGANYNDITYDVNNILPTTIYYFDSSFNLDTGKPYLQNNKVRNVYTLQPSFTDNSIIAYDDTVYINTTSNVEYFKCGYNGQLLNVGVKTSVTPTLIHNATYLKLKDGVNKTLKNGDFLRFINIKGCWVEL